MVYCPNSECPQPQNASTAKFCQTCGTPLILHGRYRLLSLLGQGGFGRTLLAEQVGAEQVGAEQVGSEQERAVRSAPSADRRCVVKQLHRKAVTDSLDFIDEAERLRKLGEHPQIPRLIDDFENNLGQFLVQEFAPGRNLQQQVEQKGPWDEAEVRSLLKSLSIVLQYVHSFQIIHRDIKPANIVAANPPAQSPQRSRSPMLVDFGSAKWVRQAPAQTVIGSAGYASPEQSMGQATYASDIYSLGLTCLYLLTGIHPFQLYSAVEDRWVWQDYLSSPLEPRLVQVLNQMVARSLQQRYESADQVLLDLQFSQNLRLNAPQQLIAEAKKTAEKTVLPGLKNLQKTEGSAVLSRLKLGSGARSSKVSRSLLTGKAHPLTPAQVWLRKHRLAVDTGLIKSLAVSADAKMLASGSSDGSVRLWQLSSAKLIHTFERRRFVGSGHSSAVTALAFHPDNRALYSASEDGTIKEWDADGQQLLNTLPVAGWTPTDLVVTPDGGQLMSANRDGKIVVWEIASLLPVAQLTQHQRSVNALALASRWSNSGTYLGDLLASASDDGTVKLWRPTHDAGQTLQLAKTLNLRHELASEKSSISKEVRAVAIALQPVTHQTYQLAVAASTGALLTCQINEYLELSEPACLHRFSAPIRAIALGIDPQSNQQGQRHDGCLAVATEDSVLTLWQLNSGSLNSSEPSNTGECVAQLAHDWGLSAIAFTPDGRSLIAASDDETISFWQRES